MHIYISEVPLYVQCAVHVLNAMYTFLCAVLLGKGTLNANQSMVALLNLLLLKLEISLKKILDLTKMKCRSDFAGEKKDPQSPPPHFSPLVIIHHLTLIIIVCVTHIHQCEVVAEGCIFIYIRICNDVHLYSAACSC